MVYRVDPATGDRISIAVPPVPSRLVATQDTAWVLSPDEGSVSRIDPASNRSTVVPVARCCDGELAAGERALWVANALVLLPRMTDHLPHHLAVGDGAVWVTSASPRADTANLLWRVVPATNQVTGTTDLGPAAGGVPTASPPDTGRSGPPGPTSSRCCASSRARRPSTPGTGLVR
jgi:hypothetical protein